MNIVDKVFGAAFVGSYFAFLIASLITKCFWLFFFWPPIVLIGFIFYIAYCVVRHYLIKDEVEAYYEGLADGTIPLKHEGEWKVIYSYKESEEHFQKRMVKYMLAGRSFNKEAVRTYLKNKGVLEDTGSFT